MSDFQALSALTTLDTPSISQGSTHDRPQSSPTISSSSPTSEVGNIDEIIQRIHREKIPYIGIYKPGELGRQTWRAVVPSNAHERHPTPGRGRGKGKGKGKGKGRGPGGQWESIVFSTPSRGEVDRLITAICHLAEGDQGEEDRPEGIRHIVNPHCDQDEGVRIVWPGSKGEGEMKDWSRRDRMMREGKTVRAPSIGIAGEGDMDVKWAMPNMRDPLFTTPVEMAQSSEWDNTAWTRLV